MFWYTTEDIKLIMNGELDREILRRLNDATAIICYNDQIARYFSRFYLLKLIKKIPDDISIISFDDLELESAIGLTTFAHPKKEMGKTVAIQLLKLMENPSLNVSVKFPPNLVERESVKTF